MRNSDYLNRINLYRQRVWTCKVTGKTNMTYEEAMVSEKHATEKVQQIPKELMAPALRIIQYSKNYSCLRQRNMCWYYYYRFVCYSSLHT